MVDENCTKIHTKEDIKTTDEKCKELALSNIRNNITVNSFKTEPEISRASYFDNTGRSPR